MKSAKTPALAFRRTVLPNGLTVITERQPGVQALSIGVWVKAGTRHEHKQEAGVSHYLEHMLFKGTRTRSAFEIARAIDRVGGEFNAYTAREYTCFHLLVLHRDLDLAIEILIDVLLHSKFEGVEMERERQVILQEIAMVEESPEEVLNDVFFERFYPNHGLGRPILGPSRSIRKMPRAVLKNYCRRHYQPEQLFFSVAGDVSHDAVMKRIKELSQQKGREVDLEGLIPPVVPPGANEWVIRPAEQVHLLWGVEGPRYSSADRYATFLLNVHLGGGMSSALFQEIREKKGLAYSVYSMLSPFSDTGAFNVYAATGMANVPVCVDLIEKCTQRMVSTKLTRSELKAMQENLKGTILLSADNAESRMFSIAKNEIFLGKYVSPTEACASIDQVTAEDIQIVARKLFTGTTPRLLALGAKPSRAVATKLKPAVLPQYCRT